MSKRVFEWIMFLLGAIFTIIFAVVVMPPLIESGDVIGAFAAGFVNPYSSGYSTDVFVCGAILFVWIFYERSKLGIKHGWIAIPISFVPGVATAFAAYLIIRSRQLG